MERNAANRVDGRAGHYERKLETKAGEVKLRIPKLRRLPFEIAIIERYKRREASVEEALVEMYLVGLAWLSAAPEGPGAQRVRLIISDACRGLAEAVTEVFPQTDWQRCVVHLYGNVFSHTPNGKVATEVVSRLKELKLRAAAELVERKRPSGCWARLRG